MATNDAVRRYRTSYARLLRLYPKSFRERFAEGMAQTFQDLCRAHRDAGQGLFRLSLWTFFETSAGIVRENMNHMSQPGKTILRVALGALAMLMVPLVASQLVEGWNWPAAAFVRVYFLFFATGMVFSLVASRMSAWSYKAAVGLALVSGFALGWSNMVHVAGTENPANLWYYSVLGVGAVGALVARLRASGLSRTLFAMAAVLALIAVILPSGAQPDAARRMAIGHGVLVVMFTVSGLLFRRASLAGMKEN